MLTYLLDDITQSVAPWVKELLDHYPVYFYSGQLDILAGPVLQTSFISVLQYSGAIDYATALREIWRVDDEIAGYVKTAGNLTEVAVRLAGHMAPIDQPKWVYDILLRLTTGKGF